MQFQGASIWSIAGATHLLSTSGGDAILLHSPAWLPGARSQQLCGLGLLDLWLPGDCRCAAPRLGLLRLGLPPALLGAAAAAGAAAPVLLRLVLLLRSPPALWDVLGDEPRFMPPPLRLVVAAWLGFAAAAEPLRRRPSGRLPMLPELFRKGDAALTGDVRRGRAMPLPSPKLRNNEPPRPKEGPGRLVGLRPGVLVWRRDERHVMGGCASRSEVLARAFPALLLRSSVDGNWEAARLAAADQLLLSRLRDPMLRCWKRLTALRCWPRLPALRSAVRRSLLLRPCSS